jgi:hypothetical protein
MRISVVAPDLAYRICREEVLALPGTAVIACALRGLQGCDAAVFQSPASTLGNMSQQTYPAYGILADGARHRSVQDRLRRGDEFLAVKPNSLHADDNVSGGPRCPGRHP